MTIFGTVWGAAFALVLQVALASLERLHALKALFIAPQIRTSLAVFGLVAAEILSLKDGGCVPCRPALHGCLIVVCTRLVLCVVLHPYCTVHILQVDMLLPNFRFCFTPI